jgi:flagellar hook-length control protein FliK
MLGELFRFQIAFALGYWNRVPANLTRKKEIFSLKLPGNYAEHYRERRKTLKIDNTLIPGLASAPAGTSPDAVVDSGEFALAMDQATVIVPPPDPGAIMPTMNGEEANPIQPIAAGQTLDLLQSQTNLASSQVVSPVVPTGEIIPTQTGTQTSLETEAVLATTSSEVKPSPDAPDFEVTGEDELSAEEAAALLAVNLNFVALPDSAPGEAPTESLLGDVRAGKSADPTNVVQSHEKATLLPTPQETLQVVAEDEPQVKISGLVRNEPNAPQQVLDPEMLSAIGLTEISAKDDQPISSEPEIDTVTSGKVVITSSALASQQSFEDRSDSDEGLLQSSVIESARPAEVGFQEVGLELKAVDQTQGTQKVTELPKETQQEVMQQTVDRIEKMAMHRPISVMTVRLMPEDLGAITVQIKTMGNKSEAEITATNERVVQALEANRPQLVQVIEAKGAGLSEMSLRHDASANQQGQQGTKQEAERNQNFANNVPMNNLPGQAVVSTDANWNSTGTKSLNMVI